MTSGGSSHWFCPSMRSPSADQACCAFAADNTTQKLQQGRPEKAAENTPSCDAPHQGHRRLACAALLRARLPRGHVPRQRSLGRCRQPAGPLHLLHHPQAHCTSVDICSKQHMCHKWLQRRRGFPGRSRGGNAPLSFSKALWLVEQLVKKCGMTPSAEHAQKQNNAPASKSTPQAAHTHPGHRWRNQRAHKILHCHMPSVHCYEAQTLFHQEWQGQVGTGV